MLLPATPVATLYVVFWYGAVKTPETTAPLKSALEHPVMEYGTVVPGFNEE
jgi:hypothetical protein